MPFRTKLLAWFAALGLAAIAVTDWQASTTAAAALEQSAYDRLASIRETKRQLVERYFRDLANHVLALSTDEASIEALEQFRSAWSTLPDPPIQALHKAFVVPGSRDLLLTPPGLGAYGRVHARFHPTLHRYQTAFGFYDIFLIDASGDIVYTVFKEPDLGANLRQPPLSTTTLARAFERALSLPTPEQSVLEDYAPYAPSQHSPAAFAAAPIWRAGAKVGVLAIQVSAEEVTRAMMTGTPSEAYLIGKDGRLRSPTAKAAILSPAPKQGETLRSEAQLAIPGLDWILVTEIETAEAFAPIRSLRRRTVGAGLLVASLFLAAAWKLGRSVTGPVLALAAGARRLANRDFHVRLPVTTNDEIGELAASFNDMAERLDRTTVSRDELERLNQRLIRAQEDERSRLARELHDDITQRLAALAIRAGRLKQQPQRAGLEELQHGLSRISDDIHGFSRRLHPAILDDLGLIAAIESECRGFFESGGPPVDFQHSGEFEQLAPDARLTLYRIVQESLRNTLRHASATEVSIHLAAEPTGFKLTISDNGVGFDRSAPGWHAGLGLASMEERMRLLGGTLRIESDNGVRITAEMPA